MKTVGVRELKAHLSRVLHDVAAGDVFLVTDRGRVVAELRSPGTSTLGATPTERALARLAASGRMRLAEGSPADYSRSPLESSGGLARRLLDEDRGE